MPGLMVEFPAACDPVTLDDAKNFLRVDDIDDDDTLITGMISAATYACEIHTKRSFISKGFLQTMDAFPYFTDTQLSQLAYPPSYYALPKFSTTLWNYSQMIKLFRPPCISVDRITYMDSDSKSFQDLVPQPKPWYPQTVYTDGQQCIDFNGNLQTLVMGDPSMTGTGKSGILPPTWNTIEGQFTPELSPATAIWRNDGDVPRGEFGAYMLDNVGEPARVFPGFGNSQGPNGYWPSVLYIPNAVQIHFTAGYGTDPSDVPANIRSAIMMMVGDMYENRIPQKGEEMTLPRHVRQLLAPSVVWDMSPTRG
jgi:hypothetical protein